MRTLVLLLASCLAFMTSALAQQTQSTFCNFDDGNQITVQYNPNVTEPPRNGRVWGPGITLYVQTPLVLASSQIPLGAYTIYLIPEKKNWTLIVNKNVKPGSSYDSAQDVARAPMDLGELPDPVKTLQVAFGQMGPKQCNLRVYYAKTGAFTDFMEK